MDRLLPKSDSHLPRVGSSVACVGRVNLSHLEAFMSKLSAKLLGVVVLSAVASTAVSPAFALGGCGPNFHRNWAGQCVWGGQNEAWCVRHTGHTAVRMPNGTMVCYH